MKSICLLSALLLCLGCLAPDQPIIYELVTTDGRVLARTEVKPSIGDSYWEASSDTWYTVISIQGTRALAGTEAETRAFTRERNTRLTIGAVLLLGAAYYWHRRVRPGRTHD
jgi:hypothetical protein